MAMDQDFPVSSQAAYGFIPRFRAFGPSHLLGDMIEGAAHLGNAYISGL
jgi:hypothetical protein